MARARANTHFIKMNAVDTLLLQSERVCIQKGVLVMFLVKERF